MTNPKQSRSLVFGMAAVFALTLLAPQPVAAGKEVAMLAAVAAPSVDETRAEAVRFARAIAAERWLQSGDIGSLQEEHLRAIVAAAPTSDATSDFGSAAGSRVAEQTRVLAGQQELLSDDPGSLSANETRSADDFAAALASGTRSESAHLATIVLPD